MRFASSTTATPSRWLTRPRAPSAWAITPFRLVQYHIHSPSEHTEAGRSHALEIHLVHQDEHGNYAVVAVFVDEGPDSVDSPVWRHLPELEGEGRLHVYEGEEVDPSHLLPASLRHYQYHGSLTTPPCTETVTWNVLATPIAMSAPRIADFRRRYATNARQVQARAGGCLAPHLIGPPRGAAEPRAQAGSQR